VKLYTGDIDRKHVLLASSAAIGAKELGRARPVCGRLYRVAAMVFVGTNRVLISERTGFLKVQHIHPVATARYCLRSSTGIFPREWRTVSRFQVQYSCDWGCGRGEVPQVEL